MDKIPRVLLLSTGDSTRSQMAEGFLRVLAGKYLEPVSAGIEPGRPEPLAVEVMAELGIDISSQKPKTISESFKDHFNHVVICYDPNKERSPIFPFARDVVRWTLADPSMAQGSVAEKKAEFRRVRDEIRKQAETFVNQRAQKHEERTAMAA